MDSNYRDKSPFILERPDFIRQNGILYYHDGSVRKRIDDPQEEEINWDAVWKPELEILNAYEVNEESVFELLVCYLHRSK